MLVGVGVFFWGLFRWVFCLVVLGGGFLFLVFWVFGFVGGCVGGAVGFFDFFCHLVFIGGFLFGGYVGGLLLVLGGFSLFFPCGISIFIFLVFLFGVEGYF